MVNDIFQQISALIGSLGFPIVSCVFLWKFISTTLKDFTTSLNANTKLLDKISVKLDEMERDKNE